MYKNDGIIRRYSEGFKLKILAELSTGKYNKSELGRFYGINRTTINKWIEQYDRKDLMNTRILVETNDEIGRIKTLQKEVEQLKELSLCYDCEIVETTNKIIVKFYFYWPDDPRESFSKDITKLWNQK